MGGSKGIRMALLTGGALAAALFGVSIAAAQDAGSPFIEQSSTELEAGQVDFTDPQTILRRNSVTVDTNVVQRFTPSGASTQADGPRRRVELEFASGTDDLGVGFAQRAAIGSAADGDINRQGSGSEVRVGRGLVQQREGSREASTYVFVASDDEALTWQPGQRSEFGGRGNSFSLEDRVEVGDMSVGVTYERNGIQASLAYVEREEQTTIGTQSFNQDQSFTGVTVTMRR
jgi:hypothetical protein